MNPWNPCNLYCFLFRARKNKRFCFSLAYSKNSLTGGTPHFVRQTPPGGRSENLTGLSFPAPKVTRILSINQYFVKVYSYKGVRYSHSDRLPRNLIVKTSLYFLCPVVLTIDAGFYVWRPLEQWTRVRLGFPNARPVVFDERVRSSAGQWRETLADRSRRTGLRT